MCNINTFYNNINVYYSDLDWSSIDPAIVTATPHCNLYTTPPPPPGFNMRQAFDSNLWLFNNLI